VRGAGLPSVPTLDGFGLPSRGLCLRLWDAPGENIAWGSHTARGETAKFPGPVGTEAAIFLVFYQS